MTEMLDNRYEIVRRLGSGGMADVYLARDTHLGRDVAIKILYKRYANDEEFVARFRQEAQSAAGLNHPHIVSIYDRGQAEESYYIAMEYLEGQSLKDVISSHGHLEPAQAITIAEQILQALQFAHEHHVIHRDIKPHNIIINSRGQVKVTDFGIARAGSSSRMTETGSIIGTAQYLSPEQARGKAVEQGSDLYSVGVVLFEMLTGQVPFDGENPVAIALKHLSDDPVPPQALAPEIPDNLNAVVLRALAKDPADRYGSAEEFLADLERCRHNLPVAAPVAAGDSDKTSVISAGAAAAAGLGAGRAEAAEPTRVQPRAAAAAGSGGGGQGRRKWPIILLVLTAVALAAAGVYLLAFASPAGGEQSEVPRVVGMTRAQAEQEIRSRELVPEIEAEEFSETVPAGTVMRQNPEAGVQVRKNGNVRLVISKGSNKVAVPDLVGQSAGFAESKLREAGLSADRQPDIYSETAPAGSVISQDPAPGTEVQKGSPVRYTVSLGARPAAEVTVPGVTGMDISGARSRLEQEGLALGNVSEQSSETVPAGQVISQNPSSGTRVKEGSAVNVVVSSGPAPAEETASVPDVIGMDEEPAKALIASRGLVPAVTTQVDPLNIGKVISQSPDGETLVAPGSVVSIVVGTAL